MQLNRGQQAWVVLAGLWALCVVAYAESSVFGGGWPWRSWAEFYNSLLAWSVPLAVGYVLETIIPSVIRWVIYAPNDQMTK